MHPIKSLVARKQNYTISHFDKSKYAKKLLGLKNSKSGKTCVVIGNGPSLTNGDLEKLQDLGVDTFATNKIFKIFDEVKWRPTYYVTEDPIIVKDITNEIGSISCDYKFIPINVIYDLNMKVKDAFLMNMTYNNNPTENYGFTDDIHNAISCNGTVTITAMQLAAYMGYQKILLLGVDHNYSKMIDGNGNVVEDKTVKDYFSDKCDEKIKNKLTHDVGATTLAFMRVKKYLDEKGVEAFNATRGGKLEVFPRVQIDEFFREMSEK